MADPETAHGFLMDEDDLMSYDSPYLDFGHAGDENVEDYWNRITHDIAGDTEYRFGIHMWQHRFAPHIPLHPNFQMLQDLAPRQPSEQERLAEMLHYALPRPVAPVEDQTAEIPPSRQVLYFQLAVASCFAAVIIYRFL